MSIFTKSPISAVLTDENGFKVDSTNPLPVNPAESGAANFAPTQVTVSSVSATQLVAVRSTRRGVLVTNNDAAIAIFVGGASVTTSTGHKLAAAASISIPTTAAVYAIAASGSPTASVSEVYD
jgi:hypothetical protein